MVIQRHEKNRNSINLCLHYQMLHKAGGIAVVLTNQVNSEGGSDISKQALLLTDFSVASKIIFAT